MSRKRDLRAMIVLLLLVVAGLVLGTVRSADALVPSDLLAMRSVSLHDVSADGSFLLYGVGAWDAETAQVLTTISRRDLATGRDQLLFTPAEKASGPVIRPDGEAIAYLRRGEEGTTVWLMDAQGGERRQVSREAGTFGALHWSPDGTALAWTAEAPAPDYAGIPERVVVATDLGYRHLNAGYREGSLDGLFVMDLANGDVRRLTGDGRDVRDLAWSPDSRRLVYSAKRRADLGWNLNTDLWLVARTGGEPTPLTTNPGADGAPQWFADDAIAYVRATEPISETAPNAVAVLDPARGEAGGLVLHGEGFGDWFRRFVMVDGVPYVLGARRGCLDVVRFTADGHEYLTPGGHDFWSVREADGRLFLTGAGQMLPDGIFTLDLDDPGAGARLLIDPNVAWRERVGLVEPEAFTIEVAGRSIEGWYFKPDPLEPGQRVPTVLSIHGGPQWMYGGYFLPEFHILPRFGYGVVICNPTGSMGYGAEFMDGVRGDWIGRPAREVLAALDAAVAAGWADPERLAVMGGSYGGHLGAALTTQTPRFKAAALDRMYPDNISFWGTTDEKWFPEWEFGGRPWEPAARETYLRNSPWEQAGMVTTPTLVSHGMRDYRCLSAGAEMWFSALQAQGVPSRFLRFETEGHGIRNPANRVFYYEELLNWFDAHVLGPRAEAPPDTVPEDILD